MNEHPGRETLFHADLYRVSALDELEGLGLWEEAERGVLAVEWPERGASALPGDGLAITLLPGDRENQRSLRALSAG